MTLERESNYMTTVGKLFRRLVPRPRLQQTNSSYYTLSATCQIPKLSQIYEQYFGQQSDGCFVEVGAYDGEYVSNSSGLADKGWRGYYIEPVPTHFEKCKTRHTANENVVVSQLAIGATSGTVQIEVGGPLSTASVQMREHFETLPWVGNAFRQGETVQVAQETLDSYLSKNDIQSGFELLVIDVEGYEWNVLRNFDLQKWLPQMVIIELHDQNDDYLIIREECNNIVRYFDDNGYKVIFKDFSNTIYVPKTAYPR